VLVETLTKRRPDGVIRTRLFHIKMRHFLQAMPPSPPCSRHRAVFPRLPPACAGLLSRKRAAVSPGRACAISSCGGPGHYPSACTLASAQHGAPCPASCDVAVEQPCHAPSHPWRRAISRLWAPQPADVSGHSRRCGCLTLSTDSVDKVGDSRCNGSVMPHRH
jgi:hypothetical protein